MKGPFIGRTVAKEDEHYVIAMLQLEAEPDARCHGHAPGHNSIRTKIARCHVGHVHGAAAPAAVARLLAHKLGHHQRGLRPFGDAVAMAAMSAQDVVAEAQGSARANRRGLLADAQVHGAMHQPLQMQALGGLLEEPNAQHLGEERAQAFAGQFWREDIIGIAHERNQLEMGVKSPRTLHKCA